MNTHTHAHTHTRTKPWCCGNNNQQSIAKPGTEEKGAALSTLTTPHTFKQTLAVTKAADETQERAESHLESPEDSFYCNTCPSLSGK